MKKLHAMCYALHTATTVDLDAHAGDELGFIRAQVEAGVGDVFGRGEAAHGDGGDELLAVFRGVGHAHEFSQETRGRDHRVDAVHADLVRTQFGGHGLAGGDDRTLAAVVPGQARARAHAGGGGDVDEGTAADLAEVGHEGLGREEDALDVDRIDAIELLFFHFQHGAVAVGGASVVDDDVELAELRQGGGQQLVHVGALGDVGLGKDRLAAGLFDLLDHAQAAGLADVGHDHGRAFAGIGLGDAFTETRTATGDDGYLVLQTHDVSPCNK
eukprot:TRINITY_DN3382_c0_g1_i1.p3 TRINITY_DN3382_c0_g1~~TRINITY_DN3382_c0_g1_i1.p3  ORF type:complete len:271 (+),score=108.16 TRINITY_DN3382_c0_g1_i1:336-1148(+)